MRRGGNPTKKTFLPELRNIPEHPSNPLAGRCRASKLSDQESKALPEQKATAPHQQTKNIKERLDQSQTAPANLCRTCEDCARPLESVPVNPTSGNAPETVENSSSEKRTDGVKNYSWLCEKAGVEGEVFYQDLESLTPVPQPALLSPQTISKTRLRPDLVHRQPLLTRRAAMQVEPKTVPGAKLHPKLLTQLSQEKVPLVCLSEGNIKKHNKSIRTVRRVKTLPVVPIIPKGPEPDHADALSKSTAKE
ncbi:hypothetical protein SRHO_G00098380 [Serrasalmus rhombeus]